MNKKDTQCQIIQYNTEWIVKYHKQGPWLFVGPVGLSTLDVLKEFPGNNHISTWKLSKSDLECSLYCTSSCMYILVLHSLCRLSPLEALFIPFLEIFAHSCLIFVSLVGSHLFILFLFSGPAFFFFHCLSSYFSLSLSTKYWKAC